MCAVMVERWIGVEVSNNGSVEGEWRGRSNGNERSCALWYLGSLGSRMLRRPTAVKIELSNGQSKGRNSFKISMVLPGGKYL